MKPIDVDLYSVSHIQQDIKKGRIFREWMSPHAYRCLPLTAANRFGWDVIMPKDIVADWNGGKDKDDVVVIQGEPDVESNFGLGTITVEIGYTWHTPPGWQLLIMPVPNQMSRDWAAMTAIVETDILKYPWFLTIRLLREGPVKIDAGTALCRVMPVQMTPVMDGRLQLVHEPQDAQDWRALMKEKRDVIDAHIDQYGYESDHSADMRWTKLYHSEAEHTSIRMPELNDTRQKPQPTVEIIEDGADILAKNGILAVENYLSKDECACLIGIYEERKSDTDPVPYVGIEENRATFWNDRCVFDTGWPDEIKQKLTTEVVRRASEFFDAELKGTDLHLVCWPEGYRMPSHRDYGANEEFPLRDITMILYLNDDFEGGETFFPDLGLQIEPQTGLLLIFAGGDVHHGVKTVKNGMRRTAIQWFQQLAPEPQNSTAVLIDA